MSVRLNYIAQAIHIAREESALDILISGAISAKASDDIDHHYLAKCLREDLKRRSFIPSPATPTLWISQDGIHNDYWGITPADTYSQKIKYTSAQSIHEVRLKLYTTTSDANVHAEIWDGKDRAISSQIGSDSSSGTVNSSSLDNEVSLTWESPVLISSDFYLHVITEDNQIRVSTTVESGGTAYEDDEYGVYNHVEAVSAGNHDMRFSIYTIPS